MYRLLVLLLLYPSLYCMEDFSFPMKEEASLDRLSEEQLLLEEAIDRSLDDIVNWRTVPGEVKLYIFCFIPEVIKNLMLVNWECHNLTKESVFLQSLAVFIVNKNVDKAVNIYTFALENEEEILAQALITSGLRVNIIANSRLEASKESSANAGIGPLLINEATDTLTDFIKTIVRSYPLTGCLIFIKAASDGDISLINIYFENELNIDLDNSYNPKNRNALMEASYNGHIEIVKLLLERGANVNTKNKYGETALILSAGSYNKEVVACLLQNGADVNATDIWRENALLNSVANGHAENVKLLLIAGANVNAENMIGCTALSIAIHGHQLVIKIPLDEDDDIEPETDMKIKYKLAQMHHPQVSSLILASSIDGRTTSCELVRNIWIHAINDKNLTIYLAPSSNYYKIAKRLIDNGANVCVRNSFGDSPFKQAARSSNPEMIRLCLNLKLNPNEKTYFIGKAFKNACMQGNVNIVKQLLPQTNVTQKNKYGLAMLQWIEKAFNDSDSIPEEYQIIIELLRNNTNTLQPNSNCLIS